MVVQLGIPTPEPQTSSHLHTEQWFAMRRAPFPKMSPATSTPKLPAIQTPLAPRLADKNKARGADEAFKSVSRAFGCLSDPDKRRHYDAYGHEDRASMAAARASSARQQYAFGGGDPFGEIDPEEIFRA